MNLEYIFYIGVAFITTTVIWLVFVYFKKLDKISLNEHKWIIIAYILLLIFSIWTWRYIFDFFFSEKLLEFLQSNSIKINILE